MVSLFKDPNGEHVMEKIRHSISNQPEVSVKKTNVSVPVSPRTKNHNTDNKLESTVAGHEITSSRECKVYCVQ